MSWIRPHKPESIHSIKFENLHGGYDKNNLVFAGLSCELPMNKVVCVSGKTSSGKSCLLKLIMGLLLPVEGHYWIDGKDVKEMSFEEFLPYRLNMGYGFDMGGLINNKSVKENMMLPLMYHDWMEPSEANEYVDELIHQFRMKDLADDRPSSIPGSMRKALCVLRAFVMKPEVLVFDDPTVGLKPTEVNTFLRMINEGRESGAIKHVFLTTEDSRVLDKIVDQKIEIKDGQICASEEVAKKVV